VVVLEDYAEVRKAPRDVQERAHRGDIGRRLLGELAAVTRTSR